LDNFVEDGPVLGRKVANLTFVSALLEADPYDQYAFFLPGEDAVASLRQWLASAFPALAADGRTRVATYLDLQDAFAVQPCHCMHLSDILERYTWLTQFRNGMAANIFPVTGLTHSLSYAHYMGGFLKHLWSGTSSRDVVVTTSECARQVMLRAFADLRAAYALPEESFPAPRLETIPLGVDLNSLPRPSDRWESGNPRSPGAALRSELRLGDDPVFLYFGRIDPASKMDLLPLFAAFRRAERLGLPRKGYTLILAGWIEEDDELLTAMCRYGASMGIRVLGEARPSDARRLALYAASDVFVSPSDNIQETFGLTVAEASCAGLAVIASDFDGYRDIIVNGEGGILAPTLGFCRSDELSLQAQWWYDNQYHLKLGQGTVVDVPALARAIALLGTDRAVCRRMGRNGRERVLRRFAWSRVIEQYVALWDRLAAQPLAPGEEARLRAARHPQRMRFAEVFQEHFSRRLDEATLASLRLVRTEAGEAVYRDTLPIFHYSGSERILNPEAVRRLLLAARKETPAADLARMLEQFFVAESPEQCAGFARERAEYTLLWCLKQDYLEAREQG
jgi:glycosyltransferase involved in cell wall biosynthesis